MKTQTSLLLLALAVPAVAAAEPSALDLLRRADALMAPDKFEADLELTIHRANGEQRTFSMHVWKKGVAFHRVRFVAPADDRGTEVLRDGDDMWTYMPNLKRALKVSAKQEF